MEPRYHLALFDQPQIALLSEEYRIIVSAALFIIGQIFVVTSTWALGITGTFLGDYFGILMDHRVEGYVLPAVISFLWARLFIYLNSIHLGSLSMSCGIQCTWVVPCVSLLQLSGKLAYPLFFTTPTELVSIRYERPAGLFITLYVYIVYLIALRFEGLVFFSFFSYCIPKKKN